MTRWHAMLLVASLTCAGACAGQGQVILTRDPSPAAREARMTQIVRMPEGYTRGVSARAAGLASVPVDPADFRARHAQDVLRIGSFVLQGTMGEEPVGEIALYADAAGQRMTVTVRHYRRDEQVHELDADAIGTVIGGNPAGVALATAPGTSDSLWSIVTWDDERLFIIELADVLDAKGEPGRSFASVKALAAEIAGAFGR